MYYCLYHRVAKAKGLELFEVPTGWKYFGNLMDAGRLSICGEESFGTGSNHIRETDGIWSALAWVSISAAHHQTVEEILQKHWKTYGRNFFTRYDYANCDTASCTKMMAALETMCDDGSMVNKQFCHQQKNNFTVTFTVAKMDVFDNKDPIDGTVTKKQVSFLLYTIQKYLGLFFHRDGTYICADTPTHFWGVYNLRNFLRMVTKKFNSEVTLQGVRILMTESRIVFRLSGTGSSCTTTVRMYVECYESDPDMLKEDTQVSYH
ncbi:phosphoglucomutase, cytoplasmic-like [Homarus americanus]|uniref:phosphoglucomutase, cytoplasmic-like n=1 Tax=Homarus americanus TaxID=6706 RepID=UPI001C47F9B1|nr:phosphoglucomutase, cytoplasmic-like [Homarus americanus]